MIPPDYEKSIRRAFLQVLVLCLCAVAPPLFSLTGIFAPEDEPLGQWFQRAGIVMTVFAVLAYFKAAGIATTMIAGSTFAELWEVYHKYNRLQALAAWLSLVLVVIGTLIWAYGDLLFPEPPDDGEEQTAVLGGGFPLQSVTGAPLVYEFFPGGDRECVFARPYWISLPQSGRRRDRVRSQDWRACRHPLPPTCALSFAQGLATRPGVWRLR
jgi:hypothetical protein